ncbi:hypothetical protein FBEOM_11839 [Fusarium beomiforme]|uniref:Uncharacterized protein n=1 Tax=Fusarium beomiforme TaxID=44412 RepID=A0A9P5DT24_9HYPO|nr:hypothetical protein FBEOM_11839 [Fusarium beomiforme]
MADSQNAEEMVSWLLDDSTPERLSNDGEDSPPKERRTTTPRNLLSIGSNQAISPLDLPSPVRTQPRASDKYLQKSHMGRRSPPKASGRVPSRAATTRVNRNMSQTRPSASLQRPYGPTRSLFYDPLKFHPATNLAAPTPVALGVIDKNVRNRVVEGHLAPQEQWSGEEINGKLAAMLAATDALKPSPQRANYSTSRFTRMVPSKVRAKVSNAWERFHPKALNQEDKQALARPSSGDGQDENRIRGNIVLTPRSQASTENTSPISNIELRLNEGDNLNKSKVQRIIGGRVNRKPLADDGKSLRNEKPIEDPFSERGCRSPTTFENWLKNGSNDGQKAPPSLPCDPFESEKGFDDNIEDRFLNSTPVGSSTPRIRIERPSISSSECCSTSSDMHIQQEQFKEKPNALSTSNREDIVQNHYSSHGLMSPGKKFLIDSATQARGTREKLTGDFNTSNRMKKHPSPSKEALEKLEIQFQQYTHVRVSGTAKHALDELATDGVEPNPSLKACEKKRLSLNRLSSINNDELADTERVRAHHRRVSSTSILQLVGNPYVSQGPVKLHKDIRLAPPYRPAGVSPCDVDELH